jgi:hypothetical protein
MQNSRFRDQSCTRQLLKIACIFGIFANVPPLGCVKNRELWSAKTATFEDRWRVTTVEDAVSFWRCEDITASSTTIPWVCRLI